MQYVYGFQLKYDEMFSGIYIYIYIVVQVIFCMNICYTMLLPYSICTCKRARRTMIPTTKSSMNQYDIEYNIEINNRIFYGFLSSVLGQISVRIYDVTCCIDMNIGAYYIKQ